jgi:hypothetical protein
MNDNEILDLPSSSFTFTEASFIHSKKFPYPLVMLSYIFLIFGIGLLITFLQSGFDADLIIGYTITLIVIFLGLMQFFFRRGVDISYENRSYKEFMKIYGLKMGSWKPIDKYTDVSILTLSEAFRANSRGGAQTDYVEMKTGVYFLTPTHRTRILIAYAKDGKDAVSIGELLSKKINMDLKRFNPQRISRR